MTNQPTLSDQRAAFGGPAQVVNTPIISVSDMGVRFAFLEKTGIENDAFRTAIIMSMNDAVNFYALLTQVVQQVTDSREQEEAEGDSVSESAPPTKRRARKKSNG